MQLKLKYIGISFLLLLSLIFLINTCTAKDTADIIFENDTGIDVKYTDSTIVFTALDNDKVKKTQNVKIHESVFENLIGFDGTSVGYTHIADDGTVTNREIDITKIKDKDGYIQFEMEFSTVIISGFTGYNQYSGTGITTNVTIEFPDTLNATLLTGPIDNNLAGADGSNLSWWSEGIDTGDRVWMKIDINASDIQQYVLQHGGGYNASIDNTMEFGSDWRVETSINTSKWDTVGSPTYSSGAVQLTDDDQLLGKTAFSYADGVTLCTHTKANEQDTVFAEWYRDNNNRLSIANSDADYPDDYDRYQLYAVDGGSTSQYFVDGWESFIDTYAMYEISIYTENIAFFRKYGTSVYNYTWTDEDIPSGDLYPSIRVWDSSQESTLTCDYVYVRKHPTTEPTTTVEDKGSYYLITVENNDATNYTDLQVSFNATDINLTSINDSLSISGYMPSSGFNVSIGDVSQEKTINASSSANFSLTPTIPAGNFSINTNVTPAEYDYNFTLYWQENVTLFHEAIDGLDWSASIDHTNKENTINGTITYTPVYTNIQNMEMVTTNANASFDYSGGVIIVYTGALSAGDHNIYLFGGTIPGYTIYLHALDSVSGATINTFAGYLGNSYLTTTNGTIVFSDNPVGTYNIAASATGYNDNVVRQTITGDTTVNINLVESGGGGGTIVYQDSGFVVGLSVGLLLILIYRRRL